MECRGPRSASWVCLCVGASAKLGSGTRQYEPVYIMTSKVDAVCCKLVHRRSDDLRVRWSGTSSYRVDAVEVHVAPSQIVHKHHEDYLQPCFGACSGQQTFALRGNHRGKIGCLSRVAAMDGPAGNGAPVNTFTTGFLAGSCEISSLKLPAGPKRAKASSVNTMRAATTRTEAYLGLGHSSKGRGCSGSRQEAGKSETHDHGRLGKSVGSEKWRKRLVVTAL